jgi:hypothetical protein
MGFIAFEPRDGGFESFLSMEGLLSSDGDPELVLQEAARLYEAATGRMRSLLAEIEDHRAHRRLIPARKVWQLGNAVFGLTEELARLSLRLNGVYAHLVRDLGVKRKWLEKAVILRRYVQAEEIIPQSLSWGRLEKGTRRAAERLCNGLPLG